MPEFDVQTEARVREQNDLTLQQLIRFEVPHIHFEGTVVGWCRCWLHPESLGWQHYLSLSTYQSEGGSEA